MFRIFSNIILALVLALFAFILYDTVSQKNDSVVLKGFGSDFTLVNQEGKQVSYSDFSGDMRLVYFGFSYCPDICPLDLAHMSAVLQALEGQPLTALFITVDPERDTVEMLRDFSQNFHPSMQMLTGEKEAIDAVIKSYHVYAQKSPDEASGSYMMNHSAFIYLMGKDGEYVTHFAHNTKPEEMVAAIKSHL